VFKKIDAEILTGILCKKYLKQCILDKNHKNVIGLLNLTFA